MSKLDETFGFLSLKCYEGKQISKKLTAKDKIHQSASCLSLL